MTHDGSISDDFLSSLCQAECSCGWKGLSDQTYLQATEELSRHYRKSTSSPDTNVEKNRQLLLDRSVVGLKKYGTTTDKNPLSLKQWLRHALEECLDQSVYLQAAITEIEKQESKNENS